MTNVTDLGLEKKYSKEGELAKRIAGLIHEYNGELSLVSVLGVLELAKHDVIQKQIEAMSDD